jgi:hypothetical protein
VEVTRTFFKIGTNWCSFPGITRLKVGVGNYAKISKESLNLIERGKGRKAHKRKKVDKWDLTKLRTSAFQKTLSRE